MLEKHITISKIIKLMENNQLKVVYLDIESPDGNIFQKVEVDYGNKLLVTKNDEILNRHSLSLSDVKIVYSELLNMISEFDTDNSLK